MFHLLASRTDFDTQAGAAANSCAHPFTAFLSLFPLLFILFFIFFWGQRLSRAIGAQKEMVSAAWHGGDV